MNTINRLLAERPGFGFGTQYCPVSDEICTRVCFSNYFDRVFRDAKVIVDLHLVFFDGQGREVGYVSREVEPDGAVQVDAASAGGERCGMVAVAAIPRGDLTAMNRNALNLKSPITTGFYVTWVGAHGARDIMHEWASVHTVGIPAVTHHVGLGPSRVDLQHGAVLMNPVLMPDCKAEVQLRVRRSGSPTLLGEASRIEIPSMGTRVVRYCEVFPDFTHWRESKGPLIVDVAGPNLSAPLTIEWHPSGDFHIHHL